MAFNRFYSSSLRNYLEILGDDAVLLGQSVDTIIGFTHTTNLTANGVGLEPAGHPSGGLVNVGDVDLDGGVILGGDDAVAGRAFSRDVHIHVFSGFVLHGYGWSSHVIDISKSRWRRDPW